MKKHYLIALSILGFQAMSFGQTPCDAGRYSTSIFANVNVTSDLNYGQNSGFTGANTQLDLDVYEPTGDTETKRPLIIWAHGGSFIGGIKTDADVVALSNEFAKKGYVCASIDYRLGMWPIDSTNSIKAVIRAVQDMKASIRYFYQDAATTDTYKIDTNNIFIGGSSAGAITALHSAYFDKECEIETYLSIAELNALGGIEGTSGNPGYSTNVQGVINLCGALASYGYIEAGDVPVCSLHGDDDGTVPYNRGLASVSGIGIMYLDGSRVIHEQAEAIGVQSNFYTYTSAGHVPYFGSAVYMDTTINFIRDFLIGIQGCTEGPLQSANTPLESVDLYTLIFCGLGLNETSTELIENPHPNPSDDLIAITLKDGVVLSSLQVIDLFGRVVSNIDIDGSAVILSKEEIGAGTYIVRATSSNGMVSTMKVVFQ
ncbi:MAG: T9SS type A sorting domain-containing protein [Crocinitomicaceae bacterium]|nr:T9SS type A sorting domain-containing protein [Crocinitomicaceae bacterium]